MLYSSIWIEVIKTNIHQSVAIMRIKTLFIGIIVFLSTPLFSQDFQHYFDELNLKGSTTIYNLNDNSWVYTDSLDANRETLPASTFKIMNSLIILEEKAVNDENTIIQWDGKERDFYGYKMASWNKDTNLRSAFKNSTIWFYVEMTKDINRKKYKRYLKKSEYGNQVLSEKGIDFWNYGGFGVTPKNQIEFLVKLYKNELPFSKRTLEKVKEVMVSKKNEDYIFRDKTGWAKKDGIDIGWWIGYLQTIDNVYFFATRVEKNIDDKNPSFSRSRKAITINILKDLNIIKK